MNKLTRGLMSGASFAALSLGSISVAEAGNITIAAATGAITVTAAQVYSFIEVQPTGTVNGSITNDGVVGVGNSFAISVDNLAVVTGNIVNNHILLATHTGVFVGATAEVGGNITNNGTLVVSKNGIAAGTSIVGILDNGGLDGGVFNTDEIIVAGTGTGGNFIGVEQTNTHTDFTNTGLLKVAGNAGGARYIGVSQHAAGTSGIEASITNGLAGQIKVDVATVSNSVVLPNGIIQSAHATDGAASASMDNSGLVEISVEGNSALTPVGVAQASALMVSGLHQLVSGVNNGTSETDASVSLTNENSGTIHVVAAANVFGLTSAHANATVDSGISQNAHVTQNAITSQEGDAVVSLTNNSGTISIDAVAHATGSNLAVAAASIENFGIFQRADNGDNSSVSLTNAVDGTINIDATAVAHAGAGKASAIASVNSGISQEATAGGDKDSANVTLTNDGTLNIHAIASAFGGTKATAFASVDTAISQNALGGLNTDVTLTNSGTIDIVAHAVAVATGFASASASVSGISQEAYNGTTNAVTLTNDGTINIHALATATGGKTAEASASVEDGISQEAFNGTTNTVALTNSGTIDILAQANAHGGSGFVSATATVDSGISQEAFDGTTNTVTLTNSGTINIHAIASAAGGTEAEASASVDGGISQEAFNGTTNTVTLTNSGTIDILAQANAHGATGFVSASATVDSGISQEAFNGTTNTVTLTNSGTINIHAMASAAGGTEATASASVDGGITQEAFNGTTNTVTLTNSGTIDILAQANAHGATGFVSASATVNGGITQEAFDGTTNTVTLTNDGTINIHAIASAAGGTEATASASVDGGISQEAFSGTTNTVTLTNSGTIDILAQANAHGATGFVSASAYIDSGISQIANGSLAAATSASVELTNSGTINIHAVATANGSSAKAVASVSTGIEQVAENAVSNSVALTNTGTLSIEALANATASVKKAVASASISNFGIYEYASATPALGSNASVSLSNTGTIDIVAHAIAIGATIATADARIPQDGIFQDATDADSATVTLTNDGTINIDAIASADPTGRALANAFIATTSDSAGIQQSAHATNNDVLASVSLTNSGNINIHASATATGGTAATANARVGAGISQIAEHATTASASLTNSGTLDILAKANAIATTGNAGAFATVTTGIRQHATGNGALTSASDILNNSGTLNIHARAFASGSDALALAGVNRGVFQDATNSAANSVTFTNSGSVDIGAVATATASTDAIAAAHVVGISQSLVGGGAENFTNSGTFFVHANASASAFSTSSAKAHATGLFVDVRNSGTLNILNTSSGNFTVTADATASTGSASAFGIVAKDNQAGNILTGTIENDGHMTVSARAPGSALAQGIVVKADEFTGSIINKGTLHVAAIGSSPTATGIVITGNGAPTGLGVGTVVNDGGTLWAGTSTDGGATFFRGDAMFLRNAPNVINVNLKGTAQDGDIYGNIDLAAGDTVTVSDGKTKFDGVINDNAVLTGSLVISANGTLELANGLGLHNSSESPAHAYMVNYTQTGTLELEVTPNPVAFGPATTTAGFVQTTNATLGGPVVVQIDPGLYGNSTTYQTIFSTNARLAPTTWSSVTTLTNSALLQATASYPTAFEADIVLTRVAFDLVPGLTPNEEAVGDGLEGGYAVPPTGAFVNLYESLFLLNPAQYAIALDMLSGEEAGEVSQLDVDSAETLNKAINEHLDLSAAGATTTASNVTPQKVNVAMSDSPVTVWGGLYGLWGNSKDTIAGPGYRASNTGLTAGADMPLDRMTTLGLAFNYTNNGSVNFNKFGKPVGNHATYNGFQIAGYGRYNSDDNFYAEGSISYGNYDNKTMRFISLGAPFGSGVVTGKFNSNVFSIYAEGGTNVNKGGEIDITPYVAIGYTNASSGAYVEKGLPGANLAVSDANSTSLSSYLGVKFDMNDSMGDGTLTPSLKVAWRHNFDSNIWTVNAAFDGLAGSGFSVNGKGLSKDAAVVGAGLGYTIDSEVSAMLDYEGDFTSDQITNSIMGRIRIKVN